MAAKCPSCGDATQIVGIGGDRAKCKVCGEVFAAPGIAPPKLCARCGVDVSQAKRTKDQQGNYYCAHCWDVVSQQSGESAAQETESGEIDLDQLESLTGDGLSGLGSGTGPSPGLYAVPRRPSHSPWTGGRGLAVGTLVVLVFFFLLVWTMTRDTWEQDNLPHLKTLLEQARQDLSNDRLAQSAQAYSTLLEETRVRPQPSSQLSKLVKEAESGLAQIGQLKQERLKEQKLRPQIERLWQAGEALAKGQHLPEAKVKFQDIVHLLASEQARTTPYLNEAYEKAKQKVAELAATGQVPGPVFPANPAAPGVAPVDSPGKEIAVDLGAAVTMKLIEIKAGEFSVGTGESAKTTRIDKGFFLGTTVVTQAQWRAVVGNTPWAGQKYLKEGDDFPAVYINWDDAVKFCEKLSAKQGKNYRLPTEAEWEYACRAGSQGKYCFGNDDNLLRDYAWYEGSIESVDNTHAHAVGTKKPNVWGLYDMHGNVWQWCSDWHDERHWSRVVRGGSWNLGAEFCHAAFRGGYAPNYRNNFIGFRICLELD